MAEFEKAAARIRSPGRYVYRDDQLMRSACGFAVAKHEVPQVDAPRTTAGCQLKLGIQRQQGRHAIGRRRGIAQVADKRAGILDLPAAHFARRRLETIEQRRQIGGKQVTPGGGRTNTQGAGLEVDAAQFGQSRDVE